MSGHQAPAAARTLQMSRALHAEPYLEISHLMSQRHRNKCFICDFLLQTIIRKITHVGFIQFSAEMSRKLRRGEYGINNRLVGSYVRSESGGAAAVCCEHRIALSTWIDQHAVHFYSLPSLGI